LPLPGCCQCGADRGSGIRREDPPARRFVTSEPIDERAERLKAVHEARVKIVPRV
jgi:hypothetical protein